MLSPPPYDWRDREDDEDENGQPKWSVVWLLLFVLCAWAAIAAILWAAALGVAGSR